MMPRLLLVILLLAVMSLACNMPVATTTTPTVDSTIDIRTALAVATDGTPGLVTNTPQAGSTAAPGQTQQPPTAGAPANTATATIQPCDQAQFIADVTIPDGSKVVAGSTFTKTWRLRNLGSCTWTKNYAMVFVRGDAMGSPAAVNLPGDVPPNTTVDLSVTLKAPATPGKYLSEWKLRSASGVIFGVFSDQPFYADIEVVPASTLTPTITLTQPAPAITRTPTLTPPNSGLIYDFAANICKGEWRSQAGLLLCPGTTADSQGYVMKLENPRLETGAHEANPVLLTQPQMVPDGAITGRFPAIPIERGYHFTATIGCLSGANACSVIYQVNYSVNNGAPVNLAQWEQAYDGSIQGVDVDLSSLAGQNVQIILVVLSKGAPDQDQALWIYPRIIRQ